MIGEPDPGSFRDPTSRVFIDGGVVWRGLAEDAFADYRALSTTRFFREALDHGDVVGTELVADTTLPGNWAGVLRHDRIDVLSYPYEWPFEMLRDAARLQLSLTNEAMTEGLITKDASSFNVQFVGTKPVFIDVGSFERLRKGEPWPGYRQFCELFLNPLAIQALLDVPFQPLLRGSVHGIPPATAANLLRGHGLRQKGILTHIKLHARADRRYADTDRTHDVRAELKRAGFGPGLIRAQLKQLQRTIDSLTWKPQSSTWSDYGDRSHYAQRDLVAKEAFVATAVEATGAARVIDLGANDGHFSRAALRAGAGFVIAVDSDDVVIDRLYRDLRRDDERRVLPLVLDLSDPSPGLGWRSSERKPFIERVDADLVLCLAVVHHLALTNTIPFDEIVASLRDYGAPVVVEFPHRDDPMASRLLARKRTGLFDGYDLPQWEAALKRQFTIREQQTLPGATRTLYRCDPL